MQISNNYIYIYIYIYTWASQVALMVKNVPTSAGYVRDVGLIPGSGQSLGEGHGAWKTISVFLPGESHGQRSLMDDSS